MWYEAFEVPLGSAAANAKKSSHPNRVFCVFRADFGSKLLEANLRVNATNITSSKTITKTLKLGPLSSSPYVFASIMAGKENLIS